MFPRVYVSGPLKLRMEHCFVGPRRTFRFALEKKSSPESAVTFLILATQGEGGRTYQELIFSISGMTNGADDVPPSKLYREASNEAAVVRTHVLYYLQNSHFPGTNYPFSGRKQSGGR